MKVVPTWKKFEKRWPTAYAWLTAFWKACGRWIPRELNPEHKMTQIRTWFEVSEDVFSMSVVPDESRAHHSQPESKQASMQWQHRGSPLTKMYKSLPSEAKVMLPFFWNLLFSTTRITAWTLPGETFTSLVYWRNVLVADILPEMQRLNLQYSWGYSGTWCSFMHLVFSSWKVMGQVYWCCGQLCRNINKLFFLIFWLLYATSLLICIWSCIQMFIMLLSNTICNFFCI